MSGGIGRVRRDTVRDYVEFRKERFAVELVPMPKSLQLSEADRRINRVNVALEPEPVPA